AGRAIVEHRRPGDYAPLAHGGNERADGGTDIRMQEHITADGASGIVLPERALRGSLVTVGERELFSKSPCQARGCVRDGVQRTAGPGGRGRGGHSVAWC